ncbi:MAG: hypothetical protein WAW37_13995 [Syntrophobacteraceae bacterium]
MPVIEGTIVNMETFAGKEGKADRRVIQVLETMGKLAELVNVSDMSQEPHGLKIGEAVRLPANDGGYVDRSGAVVVTYTFWGFKNGNGNGKGSSAPASNGPGKGVL